MPACKKLATARACVGLGYAPDVRYALLLVGLLACDSTDTTAPLEDASADAPTSASPEAGLPGVDAAAPDADVGDADGGLCAAPDAGDCQIVSAWCPGHGWGAMQIVCKPGKMPARRDAETCQRIEGDDTFCCAVAGCIRREAQDCTCPTGHAYQCGTNAGLTPTAPASCTKQSGVSAENPVFAACCSE